MCDVLHAVSRDFREVLGIPLAFKSDADHEAVWGLVAIPKALTVAGRLRANLNIAMEANQFVGDAVTIVVKLHQEDVGWRFGVAPEVNRQAAFLETPVARQCSS